MFQGKSRMLYSKGGKAKGILSMPENNGVTSFFSLILDTLKTCMGLSQKQNNLVKFTCVKEKVQSSSLSYPIALKNTTSAGWSFTQDPHTRFRGTNAIMSDPISRARMILEHPACLSRDKAHSPPESSTLKGF